VETAVTLCLTPRGTDICQCKIEQLLTLCASSCVKTQWDFTTFNSETFIRELKNKNTEHVGCKLLFQLKFLFVLDITTEMCQFNFEI
jgi:hypothetical protein